MANLAKYINLHEVCTFQIIIPVTKYKLLYTKLLFIYLNKTIVFLSKRFRKICFTAVYLKLYDINCHLTTSIACSFSCEI